ncbi:PREDICTED: serine/arginine-rich splicing factor SR45a-like isoform X3 [Populus euphratica]|uniref:Serine/arginine-rich splicing factor SR45a-like isoform X3 n=1 Tax=Populus euphratica TaxID=75702 RepID=A0AAJ6UTT1_POPEU|nr:PREDICTED: serine/arginine-rich splicing factor SR45a-like isoform X3 [Populus euphratica]
MSYSRRSRYSLSPSPYRRDSRSISRSRSGSRSRSSSRDVENPGNNLYVTGLSPRITKKELEKHFAAEGTVIDVHLVVDPLTRESRGFGFVTMSAVEEADRCIKYLDRSVLGGRVITVEKAKRRRGRTPTPGRYLGLRTIRGGGGGVRRWTPSPSPRRSPSYSPYRRSWSRSPRYSSERSRSRSCSPHNRRRRSYSRSRSPYCRSPVSRHDRSNSPYYLRHRSPDDRYYRRHRYRSVSRSPAICRARRSSRRSYSRSVSPRPSRSARRSYSRSVSPRPRRSSRRSYSRSMSPAPRRSSRRSYSRSVSPRPRKYSRSGHSRDSYSRSRSASPTSRSVSRSVTPSSGSPSH